jgi:hypothetical protein
MGCFGYAREVRVCSVRFDRFGGQEKEDPDTAGLRSELRLVEVTPSAVLDCLSAPCSHNGSILPEDQHVHDYI